MTNLYRIDSFPVQVGIATQYWLEQPLGYSAKTWETGRMKKVEKENPGMIWREILWVKKSEESSLICDYSPPFD